jgi:hypothetical protein
MNSFFNVKYIREVLVTMLVITDPPGIVPVFVGMTAARPAAERHRLAWSQAGPTRRWSGRLSRGPGQEGQAGALVTKGRQGAGQAGQQGPGQARALLRQGGRSEWKRE